MSVVLVRGLHRKSKCTLAQSREISLFVTGNIRNSTRICKIFKTDLIHIVTCQLEVKSPILIPGKLRGGPPSLPVKRAVPRYGLLIRNA
ncbi:hypothetical protein MKW98_018876 [Papaver atlanticum]|uniref:Uncharacterized protein n=1 Tax=Papaver atlanticum TaxID=357466 RepID=A0AAD4TJD0_9MAGN|nr:hypothetical protein MKW98_018876 [Papaver atlanticum]